jgi:PASTA domain
LLGVAGCTDHDPVTAPTTTSTVTASTSTTPTSAAPKCVARGEAAAVVPDVIGEILPDAIDIVQGAGLNVVDDGVAEGDPTGGTARVRAQEPGAGDHVPLGACVGFRTERTSKAESTEHAVIVHISNSTDPNIGLDMIEDLLIDAIEAAGVGEFDGNEVGLDEALLFMYGVDADALWRVVGPVIRDANLGSGPYAVLRYGPPGAAESQIDLG